MVERERLNPLRQKAEPAHEPAARSLPDRHFVVATDRYFLSSRCQRHREHGDGNPIRDRRRRMDPRAEQRLQRRLPIGSVELRPFGNPSAKQRDLRGGERIIVPRHALVLIFRGEEIEQLRIFGLARHHGGHARSAATHQLLKRVQAEVAGVLPFTVTTRAALHE